MNGSDGGLSTGEAIETPKKACSRHREQGSYVARTFSGSRIRAHGSEIRCKSGIYMPTCDGRPALPGGKGARMGVQ